MELPDTSHNLDPKTEIDRTTTTPTFDQRHLNIGLEIDTTTTTPEPDLTYYKKQFITDFLASTQESYGVTCGVEDWSRLMENRSWDDFNSNRGTLNSRITQGMKSGGMWASRLGNEERWTKSDTSIPIQDKDETAVLFGGNVIGLYPNLDPIGVAKITADAVRRSPVKFEGINYRYLIIYLLLVLGVNRLSESGLSNCMPRRRMKSKSESLASLSNKQLDNWDFSQTTITQENKREMFALMVQTMVLLLTSSTCYKFGGIIYKQSDGLRIGLRGSAALARLTMCEWDRIWAHLVIAAGIEINIFFRYVYMKPIMKGWWWRHDRWIYDPDSEDERDPESRTKEEIGKSCNAVWDFLKFISEGENEFSDNFLPTLDFSTHVKKTGYVEYKFYSKPMASNALLMRGTALSQIMHIQLYETRTCETIVEHGLQHGTYIKGGYHQ